MRIEWDSGGVAGDIVELPELGVAPIPVVRCDVFNLLCRALYRAKEINTERAA